MKEQMEEDLSEMKSIKPLDKVKRILKLGGNNCSLQRVIIQSKKKAYDAAKTMPSYITSGATGLYNFFVSRIVRKESNPKSEVLSTENLPIFIVMPENILNGDIQCQKQWISEQQNTGKNIQIIAPIQKFIELENKHESNDDLSHSSSSGQAPGTDVDILPEYSQFKDPWNNVANLEDSMFLACSQEDYNEIQGLLKNSYNLKRQIEEEQLTKQKEEELKQQLEEIHVQKLKKIKLYPFLGTIINKSDFLKEKGKIQSENVEKVMEQLKKIDEQCEFKPLPEIQVKQAEKASEMIQKQEYEYLLE